MSPQTTVGQWNIINCYSEVFPKSAHILGMPVFCILINYAWYVAMNALLLSLRSI